GQHRAQRGQDLKLANDFLFRAQDVEDAVRLPDNLGVGVDHRSDVSTITGWSGTICQVHTSMNEASRNSGRLHRWPGSARTLSGDLGRRSIQELIGVGDWDCPGLHCLGNLAHEVYV